MHNDREKGYMAILALFIIGSTFYLGYILLTQTVPGENRDIVNVSMGVILGLSGTVVGYYFGSSKSSSDKTNIFKSDMIDDSIHKKNNTADADIDAQHKDILSKVQ